MFLSVSKARDLSSKSPSCRWAMDASSTIGLQSECGCYAIHGWATFWRGYGDRRLDREIHYDQNLEILTAKEELGFAKERGVSSIVLKGDVRVVLEALENSEMDLSHNITILCDVYS